jgi:hypothetical protein
MAWARSVRSARLFIIPSDCAPSDDSAVRVTHPFHPLHGQSFPLLYRGHTGDERWVVLQRPDGSVLRLPTEWTDLRTPDGYGDVARLLEMSRFDHS